MLDDEKVAYVISGAGAIYQPFLFTANPQTVDATINIMRSMESRVKINASNNFLKTKINQLEAQLMTLNVNPFVDRQMNPYRNESRYNKDQRNFQNYQRRQPLDMSQVICFNCNERDHFARNCTSETINPSPQEANNPNPTITQILRRLEGNNSFPRQQTRLNFLESTDPHGAVRGDYIDGDNIDY